MSGAPTLPFAELNCACNTTVLLIHGAFTSRREWSLVTRYLSEYHLLIPDQPGHGEAERIAPFSKSFSTSLLANLIRTHAKGSKAHVIGFSLGSHVAIDLASSQPDIVLDLLVSGYEVYPSSSGFSFAAPGLLWLDNRLQRLLPRSMISWLMDGADLQSATTSVTVPMCRSVLSVITLADSDGKWPSPWPARTLIIAAGRAGMLPTADHPHDALKLRDIGREMNAETVAYTHPEMRHPWNRQDPELFARTAKAWFEKANIPSGFVEL